MCAVDGNRNYPQPFLKWAGGKGNLTQTYYEMGLIPEAFNNYFEPFLGGGAMYFYLWRKGLIKGNARLTDINKELINCYNVIKNDLPLLLAELKKLNPDRISESKYYENRNEFNRLKLAQNLKKKDRIRKAALLIYLNKTCFNGLYRENKLGEFNVPFGRYKNPTLYSVQNLMAVEKALKKAKIVKSDFGNCVRYAKENDFIYFDPPYHPLSKTASFTSYSKEDFGYKEQKRLSQVFRSLTKKGSLVLLSNAYHPEIKDLYSNIKEARLFVVEAPRYINSNGNGRGPIKEYVITNYEPRPKQTTLF